MAKLRLFRDIHTARFVSRPNRFVVRCIFKGKEISAYLPNPGKLRELLLPRALVYLTKLSPAGRTKYRYACVGVEKNGSAIMLHTHHANTVFRWLMEHHKIAGLKRSRIIRAEVVKGRSRFDFLLKQGRKDLYIEVKSCTLAGGRIAMFPDALTLRGTKHLEELGAVSRDGCASGVVFIVHSPTTDFFLPEYHTDLSFATTLLSLRHDILVKAVGVTWNKDLTLNSTVRDLPVPWNIVEREARDRGSYILILRLNESSTLAIGKQRKRMLRKGYYLYTGSAAANLEKRTERHRRRRKNLFWHVDYLREKADYVTCLSIRTRSSLECQIAAALKEISDWTVPGFGSTDCRCDTHLNAMRNNPLLDPRFIGVLEYFRIRRLEEELP